MKNILILSMPRTRSTLLYKAICQKNPEYYRFYEPGLGYNWGKLQPREAAALNEAEMTNVDKALASGKGTIVKLLPAGPYYQISPGRLLEWSQAFDTVYVLNRDFKDIAKSFIIASSTNVFVADEDNRIAPRTTVAYNPFVHEKIIWELAYGRQNLDYWGTILTDKPRNGKTKYVTEIEYDHVLRYMESHGLNTQATEAQTEVNFIDSDEFTSHVAYASRLYNESLV